MHIQNIIQTKTNETGYVPDFGIHKCIVIDNKDPITNGGRVQVYVPDVHGINLFGFLNANGEASVITTGGNVGNLNQKAIEYLKTFCPWAEMCSPILSDMGPAGGLTPDGDFAVITPNDAVKYEKMTTQFSDPAKSLLSRGNPFAYVTVPAYSGVVAGSFSTPRVGAQLMVLFHKGDLNNPVCIGSSNGALGFSQIFSLDGSSQNAPNGKPLPVKKESSQSTNANNNQPVLPITPADADVERLADQAQVALFGEIEKRTKGVVGGASSKVAKTAQPIKSNGDGILPPGTEPTLPTPNASGGLSAGDASLILPPLTQADLNKLPK